MIVTRITRLNHSLQFRLGEWILAVIMLGWGVSLGMPYDTFGHLPSLAFLETMANESTWAWACTVLGMARITVLIINGAWSLQGHARAALAFLSCFVWLQIAIGLLVSGIVNPGQFVYLALLSADIYTVFRASREAGERDMSRRHGPK